MKEELKLILIPSNNTQSPLIKNKNSNSIKGLFWEYKFGNYFTKDYLDSVFAEAFHLYLLKQEPLKLKDYVLLDNSNKQLPDYQGKNIIQLLDETLLNAANLLNCLKVIATTDSSLNLVLFDSQSGEKTYSTNFPTFSEDFITIFIEEYNKYNNLVETVFVKCNAKGDLLLTDTHEIQAAVIVDVYDKDRVRAIVYKALNEAIDWHGQGNINYELLIENWIKQNI